MPGPCPLRAAVRLGLGPDGGVYWTTTDPSVEYSRTSSPEAGSGAESKTPRWDLGGFPPLRPYTKSQPSVFGPSAADGWRGAGVWS